MGRLGKIRADLRDRSLTLVYILKVSGPARTAVGHWWSKESKKRGLSSKRLSTIASWSSPLWVKATPPDSAL